MTSRIVYIVAENFLVGDASDAEAETLAELAAGLARDDFDIHVCLLGDDASLAAPFANQSVATTFIRRAWPFDPRPSWRLRRSIGRLQPDLIHARGRLGRMAGPPAVWRRRARRFVVSASRTDDWPNALDRWFVRTADAVVMETTAEKDAATAQRLPPARLRVIARGVDSSEPSAASRDKLLAELALPRDARLIAVVDPLEARYNVKQLIWAFELIHFVCPTARLLIIGDGPQQPALARFAVQLEADTMVRFMGRRDDLRRLLGHVDVVWSAARRRGLNGGLLQAMAAGRPIVAADSPGHRELIDDGESGLLLPWDDRAGHARAIRRLLEDWPLAQRLGDAARQKARQRFSIVAMIEGHAALYRELLREA